MSSKGDLSADARSPLAGCGILIIALLVMVFLIGFSTVALFRQFNEIVKFTDEAPKPVAVTSIEGHEAAFNALMGRVETFRQQLDRESPAKLELTADEINLLIAGVDAFKELRTTFRVEEVTADGLRIRIAFPLNGRPRIARPGESGWITSDNRYLNGFLLAHPVLLKRELVLRLERVEVPNVAVPHEFTEQMSPYRIAERYLTDPIIGPAMGKLSRVGIQDGKLVLEKLPGEVPSDEISEAQVDHAGKRFMTILGLAACVFLVFAGTVIFIGMRAKARNS